MIDAENEQSDSVIENTTKPSFYEKVINASMAYKVILPSIVIGIIAVGMVWMSMTPQAGDAKTTDLVLPLKAMEYENQKISLLETSRIVHGSIKQLLETVSSQIDESRSLQIENSVLVNSGLQGLGESIKQINKVITELRSGQKDLSQQVSESSSVLDTIAKDVQLLKVVKKNHASQKKPRSVKTPPFSIDAIDVWDDVSYVAISQSGLVSFLKVGDQQAGWTLTRINHLKAQVSFQGAAGNIYSTSIKR